VDARPIRRLLWLFAGAFVLHEAEEWNLVAWERARFTPTPAFDDAGARTLLVLFSLLAVSFTALCLKALPLRAALFALLPLYLTVVFGNALTHIVWTVAFRSYAPGVVTSVLLLLPLGFVLARRVLRERAVPAAYVATLLALALAQPIGAAVAGRRLTGSQQALQQLGAELARSLWGPE
jgi:hypothetical protein